MRLTPFAALALAAASAASAQAQSLVDVRRDSLLTSHRVVFTDGARAASPRAYDDSIRSVISTFYLDQFRSFYDPEAPYFLFMSRDAALAMGIGGAVRMRGYYDWGGAMPAPAFAPYLIPMRPDPTSMRRFGTTPAGTCLFFRVIGRNRTLGHYQLYIEANFNGWESRDFRLKKAYAVIHDFTVGYDVTTFSDPAALPPMVDANGPNNKIAPSNVLVRYMPRHKNWVFAISAETPSTRIGADGTATKALANWIPDAAAFVQYQWGPTSHVRLAGIVRSLSYRDMKAARNRHRAGWGVMVSTVNHPNAHLTTYLCANYGHGYASMGGDLAIGNFDLIADPGRPGRLYSPGTLGWYAGVQWNFTPMLFVSASVSQSRLFSEGRDMNPDEYRHGLTACVNCFWNLTQRIQVGVEYVYGRRTDFSGRSRGANRIGAMTMFSF